MQQEQEFDPNYYYLNNYKLLKKLGSGSFGYVFQFIEPQSGLLRAMKVIRDPNQQNILKEFQLVQDINHKNIVNVIEIIENATFRMKKTGQIFQTIAVILELAEKGDLYKNIIFFKRWSEKVSRSIFHQLINTIEFLQQKNLCHRDLKLENLLFDKDFNLKVADFGFTKNDTGQLNSYKGSGIYMAPEIRNKKQYSGAAVDVFSAGVILFAFTTGGAEPFQDQNRSNYDLLQNDPDAYWKKFEIFELSDELKMLITNMLVKDPQLRFNIKQIKESQWYQQEILNQTELYQILNQKNLKVQNPKKKEQKQDLTGYGKGAYRSTDNQIDDQEQILDLYTEQLEQKRQIQDSQILLDSDILSSLDKDSLFRLIIVKLQPICQEINLDDEEYSIQCLVIDQDSDQEIIFNVELFNAGNQQIQIHVYKEQGSLFKYYNILNEFYQSLEEKQSL